MRQFLLCVPAGGNLLQFLLASHCGIPGWAADLPASPTKEPGKKQEVLQKAQLETKSAVKEVKEKTPPSPATRMHYYALEVWIKVQTSPGNFMPPEEESHSADFVLDTLNLTYPGCTGVFLVEPGHAFAFYG